MENIAESVQKAINSLQIPNPFRDVITLAGGFTSLVFLNALLKTNLIQYFGLDHLNQIELSLAIAIVSLVWGKFLVIASNIILDLINLIIHLLEITFLNVQPFKVRWAAFKIRWRSPHWKIMIGEILNPPFMRRGISYREVENEISLIEISEVLNKYPNLSADLERLLYNSILLRILLSTSVIVGILVSPYYLFLALFSLYWLIQSIRSINNKDYLIYRAIVKLKGEEVAARHKIGSNLV
jgi:hypothetical protein